MRSSYAACIGALATFLSACGGSAADESAVDGDAIIRGTVAPASRNGVVYIQNGGICTGSLVAPNLVMTARHCVSQMTDMMAECLPNGTAKQGGGVGSDLPLGEIFVAVRGKDGKPANPVNPSKIITDKSKNLCSHDIAFLLLKTPITGVPIVPLRLENTSKVGEAVTAIGWGYTELNAPAKTLMERKISLLEVGPGSRTSQAELLVAEGPCHGDSGGPLLSAKGAAIGVTSIGGDDSQTPSQAKPSAVCMGAKTKTFYTKIAQFKSLVDIAFLLAGAKPTLE